MRFCGNCGTRLEDGMRFCPNCGAPTPEDAARTTTQTTAQTDAQTQTAGTFAGTQTASGTANTAQSEPLHAEVVTKAPTPAPKTNGFAIAGLVLSIVGLVQCVREGGGMKGFAIAGIAVSAVSLIYTVYVLIVAAILLAGY